MNEISLNKEINKFQPIIQPIVVKAITQKLEDHLKQIKAFD